MNIQSVRVTETMAEAIQLMHPADIEDFFKSMIEAKVLGLKNLQETRALTDLNANVMLLTEMKNVFIALQKK